MLNNFSLKLLLFFFLLLLLFGCGQTKETSSSPTFTPSPTSTPSLTALSPAKPTSSASGGIEIPAEGEVTTLPLHILARLGKAGQKVTAQLRLKDGTTLARTFNLLPGEDGQGLLVANLAWEKGQPSQTKMQEGTLELQNEGGSVLAKRSVLLLGSSDEVTKIKVYWLVGETLQPEEQLIPKTQRVGAAVLNALLWGPTPPLPGATSKVETALPSPAEVLSFSGRKPAWGARVQLLNLKIVNGVATADFSKEMQAYGGGSTRVKLIREQITKTLQQFPTVKKVVIAVEGKTEGVLQP